MKTSYAALLAVALSTLATSYANAEYVFNTPNAAPAVTVPGKTRAQVLAELADAQRTGNLIDGHTGKKLNELRPDLYPAKAVVPGKTRAQVLAELVQAERTGDMIAPGDSGKKLNELRPDLYPAKAVVPGKTRAQVYAELVQAERSGQFSLVQNHGG